MEFDEKTSFLEGGAVSVSATSVGSVTTSAEAEPSAVSSSSACTSAGRNVMSQSIFAM